MSLPKSGKVPLKGPQSQVGFPMPSLAKTGAGSSPATIKTMIQQATPHSQVTKKASHGTPSSAARPSTSGGAKIKTVIQTSTKASTSKK